VTCFSRFKTRQTWEPSLPSFTV